MSAKRNLLKYKGYIGAIRLDVEESSLRGRIINIDDIVTFQGKTIDEVKAEFVNSVNDYLEQCAESGEDPNKPFSGNLTLRMKPQTHRTLDAYAKAKGTPLNGQITKILDKVAARYQIMLMRGAVGMDSGVPSGKAEQARKAKLAPKRAAKAAERAAARKATAAPRREEGH